MIELFKILKGIHDPSCVSHFDLVQLIDETIRTRGNNYKLIQHHCHYDLRKLSFTSRVIPIWNSLPNHVVSADTINTFKNHLDKFWLIRKCFMIITLISMASETVVYCSVLCNKYLWFYVYFSDTEASQACFCLLHDDDDDDDCVSGRLEQIRSKKRPGTVYTRI